MNRDLYKSLQEIEKEEEPHEIKDKSNSDYREFDDFVSKVREVAKRDHKNKLSIIITRIKGILLVVTLYLLVAFVWFYGWFHLNMKWEFLTAPILLILTWVLSRSIGAIVFGVIAFGAFVGLVIGGAIGAIFGVIQGVIALRFITVGFFALRLISIGLEKVGLGFNYQRAIIISVSIAAFYGASIVAMIVTGFVYAALEKIQLIAMKRNFRYFDDVAENIIPHIKSEAFWTKLSSYLLFPPFILFLALLFSQRYTQLPFFRYSLAGFITFFISLFIIYLYNIFLKRLFFKGINKNINFGR